MALARWTATAQDAEGNAVAGCSIEVRSEETGRLVQVYADRAGTVALGNPFVAPEATFGFHVEGGAYKVTAIKGAFQSIWRYVAIGTASEFDYDQLIYELQAGLMPVATFAEIDGQAPGEDQSLAAIVLADPDPTRNGYYLWNDGAGQWQRKRPLSDTLARLTVVGGTANALEALASPGVDPGAVLAFFIDVPTANTGPVTISINEGPALPVNSSDGREFLPGEFSGRMLLSNEGGALRSILDEGVIARAALEADRAEAAAAIAQQGDGKGLAEFETRALAEAWPGVDPMPESIVIRGDASVDDGLGGTFSNGYSSSDTIVIAGQSYGRSSLPISALPQALTAAQQAQARENIGVSAPALWGLILPETRKILDYWYDLGAVVEPKSGRTFLIDATIDRLKTAGIFPSRVELLYFTAAHDEVAALTNWVNPGEFQAEKLGNVTFTPDRGFQSDGVAGSYVDTTWAPASDAQKISQNDGHFALWSLTQGNNDTVGHTQIAISPRSPNNNFSVRANSGVTAGYSITDGRGLFAWSRSSPGSIRLYLNAVRTDIENESSGYTGGTLRMLSSQIGAGTYSPIEQPFMSLGTNLNDSQQTALYGIVSDYLTAVGAL